MRLIAVTQFRHEIELSTFKGPVQAQVSAGCNEQVFSNKTFKKIGADSCCRF